MRPNLRLPTRWVGEEGYSYAEQVENKQGTSEEAHAKGIGKGANYARDYENDDDAVAKVAEEKLGVNNTEQGQKEHEDWEFKGDAQAKNDCQKESGIVLDREDRVEAMAKIEDQDLDGARQNPAVAEIRTGEEEADGGRHEGPNVALLMGIHAGRDEEPNLKEDERTGQDSATDE